jgi:FtsH-binding integral membrane protein
MAQAEEHPAPGSKHHRNPPPPTKPTSLPRGPMARRLLDYEFFHKTHTKLQVGLAGSIPAAAVVKKEEDLVLFFFFFFFCASLGFFFRGKREWSGGFFFVVLGTYIPISSFCHLWVTTVRTPDSGVQW